MDSNELMQSVIGRIATGPELSKNISFAEATDAMNVVLADETSDVRKGIFLIALRMKRETMDENKGILQAIIDQTDRVTADVETLIDIGDPYSGFDRSVPISSFLPPLLAELGLPTIIHSLQAVSPKYGLTHYHVSEALGLNPLCSVAEAQGRIEDSSIGWSYVDQSIYCKPLHDMVPLRDNIIKRSVINTIETLIKPISGHNTHSVLGFVHKPYPPIYASLTAHSGFDRALFIRGVEGGVVPSLRQKGLAIGYQGEEELKRYELNPADLGIDATNRAIPMPEGSLSEQAKVITQLGHDALSGKAGDMYNGLLLTSVLVLLDTGKANSTDEAVSVVKSALDSGNAAHRLTNG